MTTQQIENNRFPRLLLEVAKDTTDWATLNNIVATLSVNPRGRSTQEREILEAALRNKSIHSSTLRMADAVETDPEIHKIINNQLVIAMKREETKKQPDLNG